MSVVNCQLMINETDMSAQYPLYGFTTQNETNRIPFAQIDILSVPAEDGTAQALPGLTIGSKVELLIGYDNESTSIFKGKIEDLRMMASEQHVIRLICKSAFNVLTKTNLNKIFHESKDSDIISQVCNIPGQSTFVESTSVTHKQVVSSNLSEWDFLVSRAELNGMVVFADGDTLKIQKPLVSTTPEKTYTYQDNVLKMQVTRNVQTQFKNVEYASWDAANQAKTAVTSAAPTQSNVRTLQGDEQSNAPDKKITLNNAVAQDALQVFADARHLKNRLAMIQGTITVLGQTGVLPGQFVNVAGLGAPLDGPVVVRAVAHEFDEGHWISTYMLGLDDEWFAEKVQQNQPGTSTGYLNQMHGLAIGVVTDNEDPEGAFRVRVRLPMIETETDGVWARVTHMDAGDGRGSVFFPEIGDEVLVGFIQNDTNNPVILGMLHSAAKASPIPGSNDNHIKGIQTRSGIKLLFDDDKKVAKMETPGGNILLLDEDDSGDVKLEDKNGNSITLNSSGIAIKDMSGNEINMTSSGIEIKSPNITLSASASLSMSGSGSAKVEASGTLTLKGGMVMIN